MVSFEGVLTPEHPRLTQRQQRGALLAGGIGFGLIALGLDILGPAFTVAASFIISLTFAAKTSNSNNIDNYLSGLRTLVSDFAVPGTTILATVAVTFILGFLLSRWILRSHGVSRPLAVTWSGIGISTILSGIGSNLVYLVWSGIISTFPPTAQVDQDTQLISLATIIIVHVILAAAVGTLSWWWMAHAFRLRMSPEHSYSARHHPVPTAIGLKEAPIV